MKRIILSLAIIFAINISNINASVFSVKATVDSLAMFIGDQATLSFSILQDEKSVITTPNLSKKVLGKLEIIDFISSDTTQLEDAISVAHSYKITAFDSTLALIPSLPFVCGNDTQFSNPVTIKIVDVPVDTTQMAIADIKTIQTPPFDYQLLYIIITVVIMLIALAIAIFYLVKYLRAKSPEQQQLAPVDTRTPYEIAFQNLDNLKLKQLHQKGQIKEYYTELTDILRQFFSNKYDFDAMESTSHELIQLVKSLEIANSNPDYLSQLKIILTEADFVKFAKHIPDMRECDNAFSKTKNIIDIDKLSDINPEVNQQNNNTNIQES